MSSSMSSPRQNPFFTISLFAIFAIFTIFTHLGCSEDSGTDPAENSGGTPAVGGSSGGNGSGGVPSGGSSSGGAAVGGTSTGGKSGGNGGMPSGGSNTGGESAGGSPGGGTGGAGTGGDPGTGGSSAGFSPCPVDDTCKILPLGDSITFGLAGSGGGYRVELFRLAVLDGHDVTFTGTQMPNGPDMVEGKPFPKNHAGISGQTISSIDGRIPDPDLQELPHIVLVHAGTNDMYQSPAGAADRLGALIDDLVEEAPDALIVVSNIIPFPGSANEVSNFNSQVPGLVEERAMAGDHVIFVDQFEGFPTSELADGVHPNDTGYARMGTKWYEAIESYLP